MWILSIKFRLQPVFWVAVFHLINPTLGISCVECTPSPSNSCDQVQATQCPSVSDVCITFVTSDDKMQDRGCRQLSNTKTKELGCHVPQGRTTKECLCNTDGCNSGDLAAVLKEADSAAGVSGAGGGGNGGGSGGKGGGSGGKGGASSTINGMSTVLLGNMVILMEFCLR